MNHFFSRKHALGLNLNLLTFASTQILLFTLFPYFSETLKISFSILVGSFSLGTALFLWGAPFWSSKISQYGEYKVMTVGLLGLTISFSLLALITYFAAALDQFLIVLVLVVSRIIYGFLASAIVPVAQSIRTAVTPPEQNLKAMFTHSFYLNVGRSLGPIIILLASHQIPLLLIIISLWTLSLTLWNSSFSKERFIGVTTSLEKGWKTAFQEIRSPLLITLFLTIFVGVLHSSLGEIIKSSLNLTSLLAAEVMAKLLLVGSLSMAFVQLTGKHFLALSWKRSLYIGAMAVLIGAIQLIFISEEYHAWIALIFVSIGIALIQPGNLSQLREVSSKDRYSQNVGLLSSGNTIGYAIGGGIAATTFGNNMAILIVALILSFYIAMSGIRGFYARC